MKKYFYSVFAAVSMLFAATSCSQDEELVSNVEGLKQTVTLKVSTPGAAQTRAVAVDGKNANVGEGNAADHLIYALYEKAPDGTLYQSDNHQSGALYQAVAEERFDGVFEVKLDLVRDLTYEIMFLAYNENNCAFDFTDPENVDLRALTLKTGDALKANQESYDAFVNSIEHVVNNEAVTYVTLKRPFAQINAATTQQDLENANLLEADVRETQLVIENVPTVYNVFTGEASAPQTVTYTRSAILSKVGAAEPYINEDIKVADEPYKYLTLAYVLAGETADAEKSMHNATFTFYRTNGKTPDCVRTIEIQNLPIQRNYRTNVVGSLITKAEDFRIEIDDRFEGDLYNYWIDEVQAPAYDAATNTYSVSNGAQLAWIAAAVNGQLRPDTRAEGIETFKGKTIVLTDDINLENNYWTPIGVIGHTYENAFAGTFDGQGHTISNLTVKNAQVGGLFGRMVGGTIKNVTVENVNIESNHYAAGILAWGEQGGSEIIIENCHVKNGTITLTPELIDGVYDNGDKAGAIMGFAHHSTINNCTAENLEISAYRDLGGIVGYVNYTSLSNNKVNNVKLTIDQTLTPYSGAPKAENVGEIYGRVGNAPEVDENNTFSNVEIVKNLIAGGIEAKDFNAMLMQNIKVIEVEVYGTQDLNASDAYLKLGGEITEKIIIKGADEEAKLNLATTYWSRINTVNPNAKVILKDIDVTSSQTSGTWNSYDVTFQCNVECENVNFLKSVALDGVGTTTVFTNVNIAESHDYYALWISAQGQNVTYNGGKIASSGRGIKIDEEYVGTPSKVTLNVTGVEFETAKKAAIMVKSAAGADIVLSNVNIDNVAADKVNAVWVDEDAAQYAGLVTVTGGTKIVENHPVSMGGAYYKSISDALAEATSGATIYLESGSFEIPSATGIKNGGSVTFEGKGKDKTTLSFSSKAGGADGGLNAYADGTALAFKNMKVVSPNTGSAYSGGFGRATSVTFENCVYEGQFRAVSAATKFIDCTIDPKTSYIYTDYADADFVRCTFNASEGKAIQVYNDGNTTNTTINVTECTFKAAKVGNTWDGKPVTAIDINSDGEKFTVNINGTTAEGFGTGIFSNSTLWNIKGGAENVVVNIDNSKVHPSVVENENGEFEISSAAGMVRFAKMVNEENNSFAGKTVKLAADIDLAGIDWEPIGQTYGTQFKGTFDGNGKTISNLTINVDDVRAHYSTGIFGWLNSAVVKNVIVNTANVYGHHNVGVIAGYMETSGCTIEGCSVTGATINCEVANDDANGDKVGVIVGHAGNAGVVVKNCTAANSTVSAGRDAGQIVGAAKEANVTGCSATNVTVTANGTGTGANIRNEIIGRIL